MYQNEKEEKMKAGQKTAIVYYSMSGNTKMTAEQIAEKTGADLIRIEPVSAYPDQGARKFIWGGKSAVMGETPELAAYDFDAEKYDTIVFGTPVWASTFAPPIRTFLKENKEALQGKRIAVFLCLSGSGAKKAADKLKQYIGILDFAAKVFLIDPKTKPDAGNEEKVERFCARLMQEDKEA